MMPALKTLSMKVVMANAASPSGPGSAMNDVGEASTTAGRSWVGA